MQFHLSETQAAIAELSAKFAAKEIAPYVDEDEANAFFRKDLFPRAGEAGLLGIQVSQEFGGSGLGTMEYVLMLEEIAKLSSGYATSLSVTMLPMSMIEKSASQAIKQKYLPSLVRGNTIGAFCLTEPQNGSDAGSLKSTAMRSGDHYVLNGVKQFITNGMFADIFIVMARTGKEPGSKGISAFIVEKNSPGVKGGKIEKKMGMRVSPTQEIFFENVMVPVENRLSEEGTGFSAAKAALDGGRISMAAVANGISRAALDRALAYAKEREQFGKAIIEFQGISFLLAEMATDLEASRLLTFQAAFRKDEKLDFGLHASMAKLKSTDSCMRITTDAVQILGGYGYMEEYRVERYMREAKMLQIVEGTTQIQKMVIARELIRGKK